MLVRFHCKQAVSKIIKFQLSQDMKYLDATMHDVNRAYMNQTDRYTSVITNGYNSYKIELCTQCRPTQDLK